MGELSAHLPHHNTMISATSLTNTIYGAASSADLILHNNAGIILMFLAQVCSTILATLGRILGTQRSGGSGTTTVGTSEVWKYATRPPTQILIISRYSL